MKSSSSLLFAAAALLTCAGSSFAAEQTTAAAAPAPAAEAEAEPSAAAGLAKGMSAEMVIKAIGKPVKIKPMKAPEGKAEVWIYRRVLAKRTMSVQIGEKEVMAFVGPRSNGSMGTAIEPVYGLEYRTIYQVTELLMFNDRLEVAKQRRETELSYDQ